MKKVLVGIAIFLAVIFLGKDLIAKFAIETGVRVVTGLSLNIGSFRTDFSKTFVEIKNLKLLNPGGFHDRTMIDIPEFYVDYDLSDFFKGRVHLEELKLTLGEFVVVKNEKGALNLNFIKHVQSGKESAKPVSEPAGKAPAFRIDRFQLIIGKVIYKDYTKGGAPAVREFNINLNESYQNITNPYFVTSEILLKIMTKTALSSLANFDVTDLKSTVSDTLKLSEKLAAETLEKTQGKLKNAAGEVVGSAGEIAKQTTQTVLDKTKKLTNLFRDGN